MPILIKSSHDNFGIIKSAANTEQAAKLNTLLNLILTISSQRHAYELLLSGNDINKFSKIDVSMLNVEPDTHSDVTRWVRRFEPPHLGSSVNSSQ